MKKLFFIIPISVFLILTYLYLQNFSILSNINLKIRDFYFLIRGETKTTNLITIVDIDEKSLKKFGQWPWKREILAQIVNNLTNSKAGIIGFDIFFPEKDARGIINDIKFATSLKNSPSILGIMFNFEKNISKNSLPSIPAIFIQKNFSKEFLPIAKGYLANIPILQNASFSSGFINMIPDSDGVVRSIPLIIKYKDNFYNSLAFEMYRLSLGINKIQINYTPAGINNITLNNISIPTDRFGRVLLNYYGDKNKFKYISAADVYSNKFDKKDIQNHFIIIGTTALGLFDLRATPFNSVFPGVEIQATLLDNLLQQNFIYQPEFKEIIDISIIFLLIVTITVLTYYTSALISFFFSLIVLIIFLITNYLAFIKYNVNLDIIFPFIAIISTFILLIIIKFIEQEKETKLLKEAFAKKVSSKVMEEILHTKGILEPKNKEITIFFSDIRSFTSLSEKLSPKEIIEILNTYFTPMSEIIIKKEGTIDKFIGDAIMAYWNAPTDIKNHADKAVESAIAQIKKLENINNYLKNRFNITLNIGIGINSGEAIIGEIGGKGRTDYTVIGDSVNLASRLESLNKVYKTNIIISEYTQKLLTKEFYLRELDKVQVKGKTKAVTIFEVLPYNKKLEFFNKGLSLYRKKEFKKALEFFNKQIDQNNDEVSKIYKKRCEDIISNKTEFSDVYVLDKK